MKMRWGIVVLCLLAIGASLGRPTSAQTSATGAITGVVTDPSGAVIPNVKVTATSQTGQMRVAVTSATGAYTMGLLPPGTYRVSFEAAGFEKTEAQAVRVTVTETGTLNQALKVGAQTQEVTVAANVETTQTSTSTLGTVVGSQAVTDLPLSTRNYTNLIALSAGVSAAVNNATALGKGSEDVAVNGAATGQNNYQMDGVSINNFVGFGRTAETGFYGSFSVPPPDAIQEFKIQTSTYDASYGRNPGANVNVVTRSGTNEFHGAAFEFLRQTIFNANDFFLKESEFNAGKSNKRGVLNQNQFGGTFGGPVKKDKLFFFVSYQETEQKNGISGYGFSTGIRLPGLGAYNVAGSRGTCPLAATTVAGCDAAAQAFAATLGSIYQGLATAGSTAGGEKVAANGSNVNPVALRILQLPLGSGYYIPSSGASSATITQGPTSAISDPAIYHNHLGIGNFDYVINGKNTLAGRYTFSDEPATGSFVCGLIGSACLPGAPVTFDYGAQDVVLKLTTIIGSNLVNELRTSYQRNTTNNNSGVPFTDTQVGIAPVTPSFDQLDGVSVSGLFSVGSSFLFLETLVTNQNQFADQISWSHGIHTVRAGFEAEKIYSNLDTPGLSIGGLSFSTFQDFLIGAGGGCGVASPTCNGGPNSNIASNSVTSRIPPNGLFHHYNLQDYDGFVQDDIKLNSRFTINAGLRWEYDGLLYDAGGLATNYWPSLARTVQFPGTTPATGTLAGWIVPSNFNFTPTVANPAATTISSNGVPTACGLNISPSCLLGLSINNKPQMVRKGPPLDNFAPRLGFAWQPLHTNRLVVRGGGGYFYDRVPGDTTDHGAQQNNPYSVTVGSFAAPLSPTSSLQSPYNNTPGLGWAPRYANFQTGAYSALVPPGITENWKTPLVYEWNLNVQYEFAPSWILELGYVGSHGINQPTGGAPVNAPELATAANPINCGYDGNPAHCVTNDSAFGGGVVGPGAAPQLRVPLVGYSPTLTDTTNDLSYKYNSLQVTVRKQFSHGLLVQAAYTWSRAFVAAFEGNPLAVTGGIPSVEKIYIPNSSYTPNRFVVNYSYELPFGHYQGLVGKLTSGWNVSGVTTVQGGFPLTVTNIAGVPTSAGTIFGDPVTPVAQLASAAACNPVTGYCSSAVPVATSGSSFQRALHGWINPGAFGAPPNAPGAVTGCFIPGAIPCGTLWGNSVPGIVRGPGQFNWDISLAKTTKVGGIHEDATLQFRAEFFNAFNHPQFNNPSTGFIVGAPGGGGTGTISSSSVNPRLIQFALKYVF